MDVFCCVVLAVVVFSPGFIHDLPFLFPMISFLSLSKRPKCKNCKHAAMFLHVTQKGGGGGGGRGGRCYFN